MSALIVWDTRRSAYLSLPIAVPVSLLRAKCSRARFETALAIDDTFAETHGALAVLDLAEGDVEGARRRTDIALRLDRNCFAAALARSLLLEREGKGALAQKVRETALNLPIGAGGRTIAQRLLLQKDGDSGKS